MNWVLITGGVYSGIGKGCLAAILARFIQQNTAYKVAYKKLEPCLQGNIDDLPNDIFGEIAAHAQGQIFDGDVARAAFYIPNFLPEADTHLSLGQALDKFLPIAFQNTKNSPRLNQVAQIYRDLFDNQNTDNQLFVVEIGGTAGEQEHSLVCNFLLKTLGKPLLHFHLTAILQTLSQRTTSKPAQLCLAALSYPADVVLVRSLKSADLSALRDYVGNQSIVEAITQDYWAERAYWRVLQTESILNKLATYIPNFNPAHTDELFANSQPQPLHHIAIITDSLHSDSYQSLYNRILAWGKGTLYPINSSQISENQPIAVIRIGEKTPAANFLPQLPCLEIVPVDKGQNPRNFAFRPDWQGSADQPTGELWEFLSQFL